MKRKAFTLIELLVVISIIILLVGILVPAINAAMRRAKIAEGRAYVAAIGHGCEDFRNEHHVYPGQRNFGPVDPVTGQMEINLPNSATAKAETLAWSLLGYYDFAAKKTAIGANNQPLKEGYVPWTEDGVMIRSGKRCFSDKFSGAEKPILYYPANRGNNGLFVNKAFEISANTSIITNTDTLSDGATLPTDQMVGGYCWDDQAMKAINYDTYLLIGPGDDRKYFYNIAGDEIDDITNFRN